MFCNSRRAKEGASCRECVCKTKVVGLKVMTGSYSEQRTYTLDKRAVKLLKVVQPKAT